MTDQMQRIAELGSELAGWAGRMNLMTLGLLLGALATDLALSRRLSPAWRIALYLPVFLRVVIPLGSAWHVPFWEQPAPRVAPAFSSGDPIAAALARTAPRPPGMSASVLPSLWLLLYGCGVALLVCFWLGGRHRLRSALSDCRPSAWDPSVLISPSAGPMVAGVRHPRIVIPAWLENTDALTLILAHERAHIARRDPATALAIRLICTIAWPIVPLWIAASRVRALMEQACDDRALGTPGERRREHVLRYADAMIEVANRAIRLPASLTFGAALKSRVRALRVARRWPRAMQALPALALPGLLLACSTAQPQRHQAQGPRTIAPFLPDTEVRVVNVRVLRGDVSVRGLDAVRIGPGQFAVDRDALLDRVATLKETQTETSPRLVVNLGQNAAIRTESEGRAIAIQVVVHPSAPGTVQATLSYSEGVAYAMSQTLLNLQQGQACLIRLPAADAGVPARTLLVTIDRPGEEPNAGC